MPWVAAELQDVPLGDPQVLGVDQIKGSEVIYPISVKTLARKQYDALREMQKRIRVALEDNDMLPGSPFRVSGGSSTTMPGERPKSSPAADPTTIKPNEINPFAPQ